MKYRTMQNDADALHLSIPAQGLPNGDATLQHATYPGMQPYPGVGTYIIMFYWLYHKSERTKKKLLFIQCTK